MPTYPLVRPDGTRARLTAPQWRLLQTIVEVLETRPMLEAFLARDLWPALGRYARWQTTIRMLKTMEEKGVLERVRAGYRLAAGVAAQVRAGKEVAEP